MQLSKDTIVAPATPPGEGALAMVRLSGDAALNIVSKMARGTDLYEMTPHSTRFTILRDSEGRIVDEVVLSKYLAPSSFTGEDMVEISCHGSDFIVQKILELAITYGATLAQPGEFTMRAFLHGKMDLSQAEAVIDLIKADSEAAHQQAVHQLRGAFSKDIEVLREKIISFAALIELELDFGEEDVAFADRTELRHTVEELLQFISRLKDSFRLGNAIKKGIYTVIAGRPNAGKSTLLNRLLREDRAIVSDIPGTTRDTIEASLSIHGVRFRIIDTAGLRDTKDSIESLGVHRAIDAIGKSRLLLYLYDPLRSSAEEAVRALETLRQKEQHCILIANKSDLLETPPPMQDIGLPHLNISAKHNRNIEELKEMMYREIIGDAGLSDRSIVTNTRHFEALSKAYENLIRVREGMDQELPSDLIAMDIRQASYHLGTIIGRVDPDDLLDYVFSNFCIGK